MWIEWFSPEECSVFIGVEFRCIEIFPSATQVSTVPRDIQQFSRYRDFHVFVEPRQDKASENWYSAYRDLFTSEMKPFRMPKIHRFLAFTGRLYTACGDRRLQYLARNWLLWSLDRVFPDSYAGQWSARNLSNRNPRLRSKLLELVANLRDVPKTKSWWLMTAKSWQATI